MHQQATLKITLMLLIKISCLTADETQPCVFLGWAPESEQDRYNKYMYETMSATATTAYCDQSTMSLAV